MNLHCKSCQKLNVDQQLFCQSCHAPLWAPSVLIDKLMERQAEVEKRYGQEMQDLRAEIHFLKNALLQKNGLVPAGAKQEEPASELLSGKQEILVGEESFHESREAKADPEKGWVKKPRVSLLFHKIRELLAPLHEGGELVAAVYIKYKQEGKLPIFFMTIAGIIAILFGFGFLMQYAIQYLGDYGEIAKIGFGFVSAAAVTGIGIRLYLKGEELEEYASALISLGLVLNYLMIYFLSGLGNFPVLSSALLGFSLIVANTGIAIFLSLKFETKVVSVLSLLGGAFAPFYLNSTTDGSWYYLYLWFLIIGANVVSGKIKWEPLYYLSFITAYFLLEVAVFGYAPDSFSYTIYYHLFAYLFFYLILFDKLFLKEKITKIDMIMLAGNLSFLLFNLFSVSEDALFQLGLVYMGNALIFGFALAKWWGRILSKTRLVLFIVIGSFIGFAIPAFFDQALIGLFWSVEAVLLILLGFIYAMPMVRKEGYVVLAAAILKLAYQSNMIIAMWNIDFWHEGFLNYFIFGIVISSLWYMGQRFSKEFNDFEKALYSTCKELVPLWLSSVFLMVSYEFLGFWSFNLAIFPLFGLIYWSKKFSTRYTAKLGLAHLLFFAAGILFSIRETNSFHFSDQELYAQLAWAELMVCFWFIRKFYELLEIKTNNTFSFPDILRITFFCLLPLFFISYVKRHAINFIDPAVWIGVLLVYLMHKKLKYKALWAEVYLLAIGALLLTFSDLESEGLVAGILVLGLISAVEKAYKEEGISNSPYFHLLIAAPYMIFLSAGLWYYSIFFKNFSLGLSIFSLLTFMAIFFKGNIATMGKSYKWGIKIAALANFVSLIILVLDLAAGTLVLSTLSLILFGLLLGNRQRWYEPEKEKLRWKTAIVFHQIQCVLTYFMFLLCFKMDIEGPLISVLLVIHAIVLLFVSMKNNLKILNQVSIALFGLALIKVVFHDISDFDPFQKILVFIVLGILLLGASYTYVRLKRKFEGY